MDNSSSTTTFHLMAVYPGWPATSGDIAGDLKWPQPPQATPFYAFDSLCLMLADVFLSVYPDCVNDVYIAPAACRAVIQLSSAVLVFCSHLTNWLVTDWCPSTITWLEKVSTAVCTVLLFDLNLQINRNLSSFSIASGNSSLDIYVGLRLFLEETVLLLTHCLLLWHKQSRRINVDEITHTLCKIGLTYR